MALIPRSKVITIAAAGTQLPVFASNEAMPSVGSPVVIMAHTGTIYVGGDDVDSSIGIALAAASKEKLVLPFDDDGVDLKKLYIDAASNNDKAVVLYFEKV